MDIEEEHPLQKKLCEYNYQIICLMFASNIGLPIENSDGLLCDLLTKNSHLDKRKKIAIRLRKCITSASFSYISLSEVLVNIVKLKNWEMIFILLPSPHLKDLIPIINESTPEKDIRDIINAFTLSKPGRVFFKSYFSRHWLLSFIVYRYPHILFELVERREKIILETFCKNHRPKIINLKDEKGNTLLHIAAKSNGKMRNIIKMLLNAGVNPTIKNNKNLTPYDVAQKNKDSKLETLLKLK